ncbi:vacuolar protein sorting-associated protein 55 isoform X1 [Cinnamomum micranthum f. kanehirae]|uniref:Vacuolar protein sorting-associated protein 55 isoform X1 n=1 Tax=Cinnamomum micranthum f. kanehirae TaxID=337451 RepID=A0A3S3QBT1_9MAGN|nr:vacuolar protein sorting-associated protein 55 isoform X1 [Cinnamomum micranthum f. kanehirae]
MNSRTYHYGRLVLYTTTGGQCYQVSCGHETLMYVLVPMPCLFFGGGSTQFLTSRDGGGWIEAAKFLTGASAVGSIAIPAILRHAHLIETPAMLIEFTSFFILVCTVLCFHRVSLEEDW